jgi:hypothetical protein
MRANAAIRKGCMPADRLLGWAETGRVIDSAAGQGMFAGDPQSRCPGSRDLQVSLDQASSRTT